MGIYCWNPSLVHHRCHGNEYRSEGDFLVRDGLHPLDADINAPVRRRASASSSNLAEVLNAHTEGKFLHQSDTAWALKLKEAADSAVRELDVEVIAAKPIFVDSPNGPNDMLVELDTNKGRLRAVRLQSGGHAFQWLEG